MYASAIPRSVLLAPRGAQVFVDECERDTLGVALPRAEVHLVVRFGPSTRMGLDVHALGGRVKVHRKQLRGGQRIAAARLPLGATEAALGVSACEISGRVVSLEDLWGEATARRLCERFAEARETSEAALILERAIAERVARAPVQSVHTRLVLAAAERLATAPVSVVALELGLSERHLRRVFLETVGVGPKAYAKVRRFRRALEAAREQRRANWASIALDVGYYDQAHLISEFRAIAGVPPEALLNELRSAQSIA